jgi:proline iminopeptidase
MGKKILIVSCILMILTFLAGLILDNFHSRFTDFVQIICFPFWALVFLFSLFLVRIRRSSFSPAMRVVVRGMRVAALFGLLWFAIVVFWPRSYGSLPMQPRADILYWKLLTGSRIAYTLIPGRGIKKPYPIIYLQGGPGGTIGRGTIQNLMPVADDGYDIYLFEEIGCGRSDRLANIRDYTADRHKRDLEAIVQQIGAPKVILIGQSWGAILAVLFAADNPGSVAGMIVTGPGPIIPVHSELARVVPPDSLHLHDPYYSNRQGNELANNIRTRAMALLATKFGIKLASDNEADDFAGYLGVLVNRSTVADTSRISRGRAGAGTGFYDAVMTVQSFSTTPDPRPKLQNTTIPILVMKGQYDNQKWGFTHEYLDLFPRHQLVVFPNAGHCIACEQLDAYLATIREFLRRLPDGL